jgi:hypothetical protein
MAGLAETWSNIEVRSVIRFLFLVHHGLQVPPEVKIEWAEVWGPWRPLSGTTATNLSANEITDENTASLSNLYTAHSQNSIHLSGSPSLRCCNICILCFVKMHMILDLVTLLSAANRRVLFWGTRYKHCWHHTGCAFMVDVCGQPLLGWSTTPPVFLNFSISLARESCVLCLPCFLLNSTATLQPMYRDFWTTLYIE